MSTSQVGMLIRLCHKSFLGQIEGTVRIVRVRGYPLFGVVNLIEGAFVLCFFRVSTNKKGKIKMKKVFIVFLAIATIICSLALASCANEASTDPWENAIYTENKTFGEGAKTVEVEVRVGENSVTFTIKTDKATLGEALSEHDLIDGDMGDFGLYLKVVNGITADYDIDKSYWSFYQNGEYMMSGVDGTEINGGEHYELIFTK